MNVNTRWIHNSKLGHEAFELQFLWGTQLAYQNGNHLFSIRIV